MENLDKIIGTYEESGVVRIRQFISPDQIQEIRQELDSYIKHGLPQRANANCTFEADGKTVRNLWQLEQYLDYFRALAERPKITRLVSKLVHGEPTLIAVETFNKAASVGSGVPYHQDNAYFCQSPPDVLTMWIAIDPVSVENGPVYYVEGSHKLGMLPTKPSGTAGNSIGLVEEPSIPKSKQFCCTLDPGDAAIHHCQTIHHSDPNRTDQPRLGLLLVFRGAHTQRDDTLHASYTTAVTATPPTTAQSK